MAILNFTGFHSETVDSQFTDYFSASGCSVDTGGAQPVLEMTLSSASGVLSLAPLSTSTLRTTGGGSGPFYLSFEFQRASATGTSYVCYVRALSGTPSKARVEMDSSGYFKIVAQDGSSATSASAYSNGVWYQLEFKVTNGSSADIELWVDGVSVCSLSGVSTGTTNMAAAALGNDLITQTSRLQFRNFVLADSYIGKGATIRRSKPSGSGAASNWTNGTGSTYAEVDETPPSTTDYLQNTSGSNTSHLFEFDDLSYGAPVAVKLGASFSEGTSTSTLVGLSYRSSGGTETLTSTTDAGTTGWLGRYRVWDTDPTGAAWTESNFNSTQFGIRKGADTSSVLCCWLMAEVLYWNVAPADLVLGAPAGLSTASLALSTTGFIAPGQVDGLSTATALVQSPALLAMASDGVAAAAAAVSTTGYLVLGQVDGVASPTLALHSPILLDIASDGVASLANITIVTAPGDLGAILADGVASLSLAVSTAGFIVPGQVDGVASPTLGLSSPALLAMASDGVALPALAVSTTAYVVPGQVDGLSSAVLSPLSAAALLTLSQANGLTTAAATVSAPGYLVLQASDGVGLPTLAVSSPALLALGQVDGVATAALSPLSARAFLTLSQSNGVAAPTLVVISPALLNPTAAGLSNATLTVISPSLLALASAGVAGGGSLGLVTRPLLAFGVVEGVGTATIAEITFGAITKLRLPGGIVVRAIIIGGTNSKPTITGGRVAHVIIDGATVGRTNIGGGAASSPRIIPGGS